MNTTQKLPVVVLVGRVNVGKSTLFNRLSHDAQSVTFDEPGVTRDFVTEVVTWQNRSFTLIDTGGVQLRKSKNALEEQVRQRALACIEDADVVVFVCDGIVGALPEDLTIARTLHKKNKTVLIAVNKSDVKAAEEHMHEFETLQFPVQPISAIHNRGIEKLKNTILSLLPVQEEDVLTAVAPRLRVAIIGKPNVGKSSLMNLLTKKDRAIVADMPGTTREAITETISFEQEDIRLSDTPGMRRKRGVQEPLEQLMVKSALRAIDAAHVVLLVVDSSMQELSDQELKLAFYAFEKKHKALALIFNKRDLVEEEEIEELEHHLELYNYFIKKVETLNISCKTGKNVHKVMPLVQKLVERSKQRFGDEALTLLLREQLYRRPLYRHGAIIAFGYAKQTRVMPITIELFVGHPPFWQSAQLGYLENQMRRAYDLKGVPVVFVPRKYKSK